jgi:hypothetical protein
MLLTMFHIIWPGCFRGKAVLEIDQLETKIAYGKSSVMIAHFVPDPLTNMATTDNSFL